MKILISKREYLFGDSETCKEKSLDVNPELNPYDIYSASIQNIALFYSNTEILPQFKAELNFKIR